ncbi:hypothetical protein DWU98_04640 [Dyella monticola]|uniref:Uncharacterized protein n=1 Tax=Dyella monticola TaxID=1927958 RepID=A0A370X5C0_9GAMM|nr:hypothetical protein [Dyella monticola]RDS83623.1 hypothetical protein DWU98_04640 [Dyella monticola]
MKLRLYPYAQRARERAKGKDRIIRGNTMSLRGLWLLSLVVVLSACATDKNVTDSAQLPPGTGIMVANVLVRSVGGVAYPPVTINFDKMHGLSPSKVVALPLRNNLIVMQLPAGEYSWTSVKIGDLTGSTSYGMPFTIEAGKINYVGDVLLLLDSFHKKVSQGGLAQPTYNIFVKDLSAHTLPVAASTYPELWRAYPVVTHLTQDFRHKEPTAPLRIVGE